MTTLKLIKSILTKKELSLFYFSIFFGFILALIEVLGVASILPFILALTNPFEIEKFIFITDIKLIFKINNNVQLLNFFGFVYLFLILITNLLSIVHSWLVNYFINKINYDTSKKLLENYLNKNYSYHIKNNSSALLTKIIEETLRYAHGVMGSLLLLTTKILLIFFIIVILLFVNFKVSFFVILLIGGMYFLIFLVIRKKIILNGIQISKIMPLRQKKIIESLNGFKELIIYGKINNLLYEFFNLSDRLKKLRWINSSLAQTPRYLVELVALSGVIIFILYNQNNNQNFIDLIPTITIFAFAAYKIMPAAQQIFSSYSQLKGDFNSINSIKKDLVMKHDSKSNLRDQINFQKLIELKNISFNYGSKKILSNFSMKIKKNNIIGIRGESGIGKSTIANIVLGLVDPQKGNVKIDKTTLNKKNSINWRNKISYVGQNMYLFDDSIKYNITLEKNNINEQRLIKILKDTNLINLIKNLPRGLNTRVGERGSKLSGGQLQRISIARALYKKTQLIILDEATSSLDVMNETNILKIIKKISKNNTILLISHKEKMFKHCNKIYHLKNNTKY